VEEKTVRVRFAPSPTGPLHIGGVRTALYNYLFARQSGGRFILRIEDTDQTRYVPGAEAYILESLKWLGMTPDEGPESGGDFGPYRQSQRKAMYAEFAEELVRNGHAYYAFDSSEDLSRMRAEQEAQGHHSAKYDRRTRGLMKNSLTVKGEELDDLMAHSPDKVIRLKMPANETVSFDDRVRDRVEFNTDELDDKVILKADGMPTYHLANIVDDHAMAITHVIRGEEWLSSTAHHVLMYRMFGWEPPVFTHLPLILKPSGKGKLSKRDGAKFGFPVFPLEWDAGDETYSGFREEGFDPAALINFLALLGWHPGDDTELLSMDAMIDSFDLGHIVKSGARFDIDKALWFNQQYILSKDSKAILEYARQFFPEEIREAFDDAYLVRVIEMMQPRVHKYTELYSEALYLFRAPEAYDEKQVRKRFKDEVPAQLKAIRQELTGLNEWTAGPVSDCVKGYLQEKELKMGAYLPLLRIMMCGAMTGPDLFEMMALLGQDDVLARMDKAQAVFESY